MGNRATGSIDSWGPVSIGISITLLQEVVGVVQSIGVSCGIRVVQSVALESIFVGLSGQVLSGGGLLCWSVVRDKSTIGMGNQATGSIDSWGPVSISLGISILQKVVGVVQSVGVASGIGVVQSVTLDSILIGLGSQMLSRSSLLGWSVVRDEGTIGMGNQATGSIDSWGPVWICLSQSRSNQREKCNKGLHGNDISVVPSRDSLELQPPC